MHSMTMVNLCSWTVEELRAVIALLKRPESKPVEIEDDLYNRIARAVHDKMINLSICVRAAGTATRTRPCSCEKWRKLLGKSWATFFQGHQHYKFEAEFDYADREWFKVFPSK